MSGNLDRAHSPELGRPGRRARAARALAKTAVGPSAIHGAGLFARAGIAQGEVIGRFEGRETNEDGDHVLWVEQDDASYRGIEGTTDLRFVNHCSRPNAEFDGDLLIALAPIGPGDEITVHYGEAWEEEGGSS